MFERERAVRYYADFAEKIVGILPQKPAQAFLPAEIRADDEADDEDRFESERAHRFETLHARDVAAHADFQQVLVLAVLRLRDAAVFVGTRGCHSADWRASESSTIRAQSCS